MDSDAAAAAIAWHAAESRIGILTAVNADEASLDLAYLSWREQTPTLHPAQTGAGR